MTHLGRHSLPSKPLGCGHDAAQQRVRAGRALAYNTSGTMASVGTFNYRRPMEEVAEMCVSHPLFPPDAHWQCPLPPHPMPPSVVCAPASANRVSSLPRAEGEAPLSLAVLQDDAASPGDRMQVLKALRDSGAFFAPHEKTVRSLREHPLTLAQGGAQLVSAPSAVDFSSAEFRTTADFVEKTEKPSHLTYYEEVEKIARDLLGEDVVHAWCTSHIIRDSQGNGAVDNAQAGEKAGPIRVVHNDFTEEYGDVTYQRLSDHPSQNAVNQRAQLKVMKGLEFSAEELEQYRMVVLNTWRPITTDPLRREPLAVCDNRTIQKSDLMNVRTGIGQNEQDPDDDFALEVFMSMPNPEHQWHYVDEFTHDECMVFKTYDSDMFPFVPTMHSAFDLPEQEDQVNTPAITISCCECSTAKRTKQP
jgi:hypothetical protein